MSLDGGPSASGRPRTADTAGRRWWRAPPTQRCWPSWPVAGCAPSCPRCAGAAGPFRGVHGLLVSDLLAHIDYLDEAIAREVVPRFVDLEVAVPHLSPAVW